MFAGKRVQALFRHVAAMSTAAPAESVVFERLSSKAVRVLLNKPQALNALDLDMVRKMTRDLHHHVLGSRDIKVAIFEGAGDKSFCAGGDVRSLYDSGTASASRPTDVQCAFFTEEYALDHSIQQLQTHGIQQVCCAMLLLRQCRMLVLFSCGMRQVALYDGFTLGGGVGISIHAPFRVATEIAMFAMPGEVVSAGVALAWRHVRLSLCAQRPLLACSLTLAARTSSLSCPAMWVCTLH